MNTPDALSLAGLVLIAAGFALVYPPLGLIVSGAAALILGLGWGRR